MFYQCDGDQEYFNNDAENIRFKIRELQNASKVVKSILELSEEDQMILAAIIHSSKITVITLFEE